MTAKRWLFSPAIDLTVFGGTALVALAITLLDRPTAAPEWSWITGVLLVDVAHVWSTSFVVYLDPVEWRRRPFLYALTPVAMFVAGIVVYLTGGDDAFWRAIAYVAVFHFIRQQYGWVMLYRARNGERDRVGRYLDGATIYLATIYPLVWWHAHLPRDFAWMKPGDFMGGIPTWVADVVGIAYVMSLVAYLARAFRRPISWGKHVVVATTAACWYVGIVGTNTDFAFTTTNVFIHGIPYMVLVFMYARAASREAPEGVNAKLLTKARGVVIFLSTLWLVAYVEEMLWDKALWHDREWLFGGPLDAAAWIIAPLLAVPQLTHYFLDAFLWKRASNPRLGRLL